LGIVIEAPDEAVERWQSGDYIQDALPMLSADERELLISGICGHCFDTMFCEEEPEDDAS
jgi:hypothetical protein